MRDLTAWQLAELLDPDSLVLHDTPSFECPRCRTDRSCWPLKADEQAPAGQQAAFLCETCKRRWTKPRGVALVLQNPDAMARYHARYRHEVAS